MVISSRKFENFELFCPLGARTPHIFFLSQGSWVRVEMGIKLKSMYVCLCGHFWLKFGRMLSIYEALMVLNFCGDWARVWGLELNFLGFQIEENFWEAKF